jgi:hypothetical protein
MQFEHVNIDFVCLHNIQECPDMPLGSPTKELKLAPRFPVEASIVIMNYRVIKLYKTKAALALYIWLGYIDTVVSLSVVLYSGPLEAIFHHLGHENMHVHIRLVDPLLS